MGRCVTGIWSSGASEFLSGEKEQLTLTENGEHLLSEVVQNTGCRTRLGLFLLPYSVTYMTFYRLLNCSYIQFSLL